MQIRKICPAVIVAVCVLCCLSSFAAEIEFKIPDLPVVAHRGFSFLYPENTVISAEAAIQAGADGNEFDVYASKDGAIIALHDGSFNRTTNVKAETVNGKPKPVRPADLTLEEIRKLDAGSWKSPKFAGEKVPTLEELLAVAKNTENIPIIEIKQDGIEQKVVDAVKTAGMENHVVIIAFSKNVVKKVRQIAPTIPAAWLWGEKWEKSEDELVNFLVAAAKEINTNLLDLNHSSLSPKVVKGLKDAGLTVWAWTVDDPVRMRQLREAGVVSITTNRPDLAKLPKDFTEIKALSFNVRISTANDGENSWQNRKEQARDVILSGDYDFVGVQECVINPEIEKNQYEYFKSALAENYDVIGISRNKDPNNGESMAIFYHKKRWELDANDTGTFWISETPEVRGSKSWDTAYARTVTWGRFKSKASGKSLYFYNTHLDHVSELARQNGAVLIVKHILERANKNEPFFLTGDFNCGEASPAICYLSGEAAEVAGQKLPKQTLLHDSYRDIFPYAPEAGSFHGFSGKPIKEKIDYIFVSPTVKTIQSRIIKTNKDGHYPSDHFPVDAVFAW
ncbi:MAG: endonuclease/exonuclease/phosphatase family protein [Planctomycetaceae bacterium]|jgi:glycerophosphoryl diester phosphodiesterase|nr:endonuclease/exonuclease/phosphatase family protein [Planctomycetaceae bacterium]